MKVKELIAELSKYPEDAEVKLIDFFEGDITFYTEQIQISIHDNVIYLEAKS